MSQATRRATALVVTMIREGRSYVEIEALTGFDRHAVNALSDWAFDYQTFPEN